MKVLLVFWMAMLAPSSASACPLCYTVTGDKVRAAVLGPDFWFNVGVTVLPFAVFLGITALIYYGIPTRELRGDSSARTDPAKKETT
jgi:hypothetical protein